MERTVRPLAALLSLLLMLAACTEGGPRGPRTAEPAVGAPAGPAMVQTGGGLSPTGERLARYLRSKYPAYENGRWAIGWNSAIPWMATLGRAVEEHWPYSVALESLGAEAATSEQAYIQLDPSSFAGLIWLEPIVSSKGRLDAVRVLFRPIGSFPYTETIVACQPGLSILPPTESGAR